MSEALAVAVVGVGYLGRYHALIYARHPKALLVGILDTDPVVAQQVAEEANCVVFSDIDALAEAVDAVSIVVPTTAHLDVTKRILQRGKHVLLEKPIAATLDEGREILRVAESTGAILQIGHLERFNAGVMELAKRIHRPRFIEAHRMSPFVARATDVDVISDLMIHDIDLVLALVDAPLREISAVGSPVLTDHVDIANARLEFADGCVANVIASRVSREKMRRIRVFEPRHYESLDFIDQTLNLVYPRDVPGSKWPEIVAERVPIEPVRPLDAEIDAFIRCARTGEAPLVDGEAGLRALEVALAVRQKIKG